MSRATTKRAALEKDVAHPDAGARWKATLAVVLGATAIGLAPILVRKSEAGPAATAFLRVGLALPLMWLPLLFQREPAKRELSAHVGGLALAGAFFAADLTLWHWSIKWTTIANATLFANSAPIFVVIGAVLLFGERVRLNLLAGLGLAVLGGALLVIESVRLNPANLKGDLVAVVAAVFYAGYLLTVKRLRRTCSSTVIMAGSGLISAPLFWLAGRAAGEQILPVTAHGWGLAVLLAVVSHAAGQGLIAYGMAALPASFSSVTLLWQPVVAAWLAAAWLGESLGPVRAVGGLVVLAGILVASRPPASLLPAKDASRRPR